MSEPAVRRRRTVGESNGGSGSNISQLDSSSYEARTTIAAHRAVSAITFAECPKLPGDIGAIAKYSAAVFSGIVTKIESSSAFRGAETVTFDVERVWRGASGKQFVVYNVNLIGTDLVFVFQKGTKYIVFAHRMTKEQRADFGLAASGPVTFRIGTCGGGTRPYEDVKPEIAKLGAGRAPSPK